MDYRLMEVAMSLGLNMVASVALIQVNKLIYQDYQLPNMSLTCLNFVATFLGLVVCSLCGFVKFTRVSVLKMLPMAVSFCGFVVLTNFSLEYNSIGTYQCLKALTTPGILLISTLIYKESYSWKVKLTIIPVMLGAFFNSMYDFKLNFKGISMGLAAAVVTSFYQVWIGVKQKEFNLSPLQLLAYQAPISALLLVLVIPFFEPVFLDGGILDKNKTLLEWFLIFISGLCAFLVNSTIYWIIGITSPLTYNMSGNIKFCLIIIVGTVMFKELFTFQQFLSVSTVLLGLSFYTKFRLEETMENKKGYVLADESASSSSSLSSSGAHQSSVVIFHKTEKIQEEEEEI